MTKKTKTKNSSAKKLLEQISLSEQFSISSVECTPDIRFVFDKLSKAAQHFSTRAEQKITTFFSLLFSTSASRRENSEKRKLLAIYVSHITIFLNIYFFPILVPLSLFSLLSFPLSFRSCSVPELDLFYVRPHIQSSHASLVSYLHATITHNFTFAAEVQLVCFNIMPRIFLLFLNGSFIDIQATIRESRLHCPSNTSTFALSHSMYLCPALEKSMICVVVAARVEMKNSNSKRKNLTHSSSSMECSGTHIIHTPESSLSKLIWFPFTVDADAAISSRFQLLSSAYVG